MGTISAEALQAHRDWLDGKPTGIQIVLRGADLRGANLRGADLWGADLWGADLWGARGIMSIGPIGSRGDILFSYVFDGALMLKTGCFNGAPKEFLAQVKTTHGDNHHAKMYRAAVRIMQAWYKEATKNK